MSALEREGYLKQPHTSSGRVPTDQGYRFFVDRLSEPGRLGAAQRQDIRTFFERTTGEIEQMLHETGRLLSNLTGAAAVVVGPDPDTTTVRSIQLVSLGARHGLVVAVLSDGSIEKRSLELPPDITDLAISAASARLAAHMHGKSLSGIAPPPLSGNGPVDKMMSLAVGALQVTNAEADNVFVGGASQLAASFDAVETVRSVLSILEQQYVVVTLMRDLLDRNISVSIGAENALQPLQECSLVVAPTVVAGRQRGSVAILGPTRMNYAHAMAAVSVVSRQLGERLSEGDESPNRRAGGH